MFGGYKLFLVNSTPSKHRVFAVRKRPNRFRDELEAVATFPSLVTAVWLADALNELLRGRDVAAVDDVITNGQLSNPVIAEVERIKLAITSSEATNTDSQRQSEDGHGMLESASGFPISGFMRFLRDRDSPARITPRTAMMLMLSGAVQSGVLLRHAEDGTCYDDQLESMDDHGRHFQTTLARAMEDLIDQLSCGNTPTLPTFMEKSAFEMMVDLAASWYADRPDHEILADLPESEDDHNYTTLMEVTVIELHPGATALVP